MSEEKNTSMDAETQTPELDTDIVYTVLVDSTQGGAELNIKTPYVVRDVQVMQKQRIPLYVAGKLKSTEELAALGLTVREYTRLEVETAYYADLYARDAAGDGALQLRVRQYKNLLDQLHLDYRSTQDAVMTAIQTADMDVDEKAALALTMKTVYDAITTNLEYLGSDSPHMDTYSKLPKLIRFLPAEQKEGE
nr:MAG TPA: hypothetical protein [Caudoviricetes sp.]